LLCDLIDPAPQRLRGRRRSDDRFDDQCHVIASAGDLPIAAITSEKVIEGRDKRAARTPHQARNFLDALRGLFRWALEAKHVRLDPTAGVKNPKRKKGQGFKPWTEADAEAYMKRWPIGTKERVWFDVLCFTGFRPPRRPRCRQPPAYPHGRRSEKRPTDEGNHAAHRKGPRRNRSNDTASAYPRAHA
jgi:integrase